MNNTNLHYQNVDTAKYLAEVYHGDQKDHIQQQYAAYYTDLLDHYVPDILTEIDEYFKSKQ